jgi:hypothetical protein
MVFFREEITISEKMKIGDAVLCTIDAQKGNGDSSQARGMAYIYHDLVIVCVESVSKKLMEPIYPHQYEYLSY